MMYFPWAKPIYMLADAVRPVIIQLSRMLSKTYVVTRKECTYTYEVDNFMIGQLYGAVSTTIPMACAYQKSPGDCVIYVNHHLKDMLTEDELKAVIFHEAGHIYHVENHIVWANSDNIELSQRAEYEADNFAVQHGYYHEIINALVKTKNALDNTAFNSRTYLLQERIDRLKMMKVKVVV